MAKVVVLGAGVMGLAAAHRAVTLGHDVTILEAAPEAGGMAAHFDFDGLSIERFYHFICKSDQPTFALLRELGLEHTMRWRETSMGYFINGALHPWGDPISLLRFPHLNMLEKFRYGLLMFISTRLNSWPSLENESTRAWIERWCGKSVYQKLWQRLFHLKFYEHADSVSALWTWSRIRRIGRSRRSLLKEELGHIAGGSQTLVDALVSRIMGAGGTLLLADKAERLRIEGNRVVSVISASGEHPADEVISTVPTPYLSSLLSEAPEELQLRYNGIENIGVVCVVLKLKRSVTPHFWVNIVDSTLPIPGIIEFTNLRSADSGETIVYVPYYMPSTNSLWNRQNSLFVEEAFAAVRRLNPLLSEGDMISSYVGRLKHAQPVCTPGFQSVLPPVKTSVRGLQIADTCFYYPEDRGVSESIRLGQSMAESVGNWSRA